MSQRRCTKFKRLALESLDRRLLLATFYVGSGGADTNDGSSTSPWLTLQHAADSVVAGDTVIVRPGDYVGFDLRRDGTASAPITFRAEPGADIKQPNTRTGRDGINLEDASHVVIDGFRIVAMPRAGIRAVGSSSDSSRSVVLRNNELDRNETWGIFTSFTDDVLIEGNTASRSQSQHGIYVSNSGDRPVIRDNKVWGNYQNGIHMNGDASMGGDGLITGALVEQNVIYGNGAGGGSAINADGVQQSTFQNNLLYDNHSSGISLYAINGAAGSTNNLVVNNTVVQAGDARWAVVIQNGSTGNTLYNNILYNSHTWRGSIDISLDSLPGFTSDYNAAMDSFTLNGGDSVLKLAAWQIKTGQDLHSIVAVASELFADTAANDFHLSPQSPAVDLGTGSRAPARDLENSPRPAGDGWDVGSYERASLDIKLLGVEAQGANSLTVTYDIAGGASAPFELGFYRSTDTKWSAEDALTGSVTITGQTDLSAGTHSKSFQIGGGSGQVALPGAGAAEIDEDYYLLAVGDYRNEIVEVDLHAINEDNLAVLSGAYHVAGGNVFVQGTDSNETIQASPSIGLTVNMDSKAWMYDAASVAGMRIRSHGGKDLVSGTTVVVPLGIWGGDGNDTLSGGTASDTIYGGGGADIWLYAGTAAADRITVSTDGTARLKLVHGTVTDRFVYDAVDTIHMRGGEGNDRLSVSKTVILPVRLEGEGGNDILTGGGGGDLLFGGAGNDQLIGRAGDDKADGGAGTDQWLTEGTSKDESIAIQWLDSSARLVVDRHGAGGVGLLESDRGWNIERAVVRALAGDDELDASLLDELDYEAAGLESLLLDGGAGTDTLLGGAGADTLIGGMGNDVLNGGLGADEWQYLATGKADAIDVVLLADNRLKLLRRFAGSSAVEETDLYSFDSLDFARIKALGGDDQIQVGLDVPIGGQVVGGAGVDTCTAPASWSRKSC